MSIPPAKKPSRLGVLAGDVAGFPNGRLLADDVVDIELRVVAGVLVPGFDVAPNNQLGDGVDANDKPFLPYFPYVAPPQDPRDHEHHETTSGRRHWDGDDDVSATADPEGLAASTAGAPALSLSSANPGRGAVLQYTLPADARVSLAIYDAQGRIVRTLVHQDAAAGTFRATWDGLDQSGQALPGGLFFARLTAGGKTVETRKLVLE
jgi:hypothetical protein